MPLSLTQFFGVPRAARNATNFLVVQFTVYARAGINHTYPLMSSQVHQNGAEPSNVQEIEIRYERSRMAAAILPGARRDQRPTIRLHGAPKLVFPTSSQRGLYGSMTRLLHVPTHQSRFCISTTLSGT